MTQVSTKLFRLDLGYFRKNFLNQETWGEKHLLYENSTIKVEFRQYLINTADQALLFQVMVKIIDSTYFVETFGMRESNCRSGEGVFSVPIDNKEYTEEVFVKQVYGAFKKAFCGQYGCFYSYTDTTISVALQNKIDERSKVLTKQAKAIYKDEKAKNIKKYINEETFIRYYTNDDETRTNMVKVASGMLRNSHDYLGEKDTKLFCDFIGLKYTGSSDAESYKKYLEMAKDYLGEKASLITVDVKGGKVLIHTEDLENKIHNLEQYLLTLKPHTPHYRDTKKHIERLKDEQSNYHKH